MQASDFTDHISRSFNQDIEELRNQVLAMGGLVESQLSKAIAALVSGDSELGLKVANDDYMVNNLEVSIDEECSRILATRSPAAGDLRLIVAIIKTITDLERVGDEAVEPVPVGDDALPAESEVHEMLAEDPGLVGVIRRVTEDCVPDLLRCRFADAHIQVARVLGPEREIRMRVHVVEPGHCEGAAEVVDDRIGIADRSRICVGSDSDEASVADCNRLGERLGDITRVDPPAGEDQLGSCFVGMAVR